MHTTTTTTRATTGTGAGPVCGSCGGHLDRSDERSVGERLWRSYLWGYEFGTAYGTTAGYREAIADMWGGHDHLVQTGLLRLPSYAELLARRKAAYEARPALTAAEIRARAAASWAGVPA